MDAINESCRQHDNKDVRLFGAVGRDEVRLLRGIEIIIFQYSPGVKQRAVRERLRVLSSFLRPKRHIVSEGNCQILQRKIIPRGQTDGRLDGSKAGRILLISTIDPSLEERDARHVLPYLHSR